MESKAFGATTYSFFFDENIGVKMFESDDIIEYLFNIYGGEMKVLFLFRCGGLVMNLIVYVVVLV